MALKLVIKLGGSVLCDDRAYSQQADNIMSAVDKYCPARAYVVVSAKKGETESAISRVCADSADESLLRGALEGKWPHECYDTAQTAGLLLQPEINSARHLGRLLGAYVLNQDCQQFPIIANSSYLHGSIDMRLSEKRGAVLDTLGQTVVVSGFGARDQTGSKVLLGRNASDLVAAMIARLARADVLVYCKDVNGIYQDSRCQDTPICSIDASKADMSAYAQVLLPQASRVLAGTGTRVVLGH
jgi:aspartokinase